MSFTVGVFVEIVECECACGRMRGFVVEERFLIASIALLCFS